MYVLCLPSWQTMPTTCCPSWRRLSDCCWSTSLWLCCGWCVLRFALSPPTPPHALLVLTVTPPRAHAVCVPCVQTSTRFAVLLANFKWAQYEILQAPQAAVSAVLLDDALSTRAQAVLGGSLSCVARTHGGFIAATDDRRLVMVRDVVVGHNVDVQDEDGATGVVLARVSTRVDPQRVSMSADGRTLLATARDGYDWPCDACYTVRKLMLECVCVCVCVSTYARAQHRCTATGI